MGGRYPEPATCSAETRETRSRQTAPRAGSGGPAEAMRRRLAVGLILLFLVAVQAPGWRGSGNAEQVRHTVWMEDADGFGGFSGFVLHGDSQRFTAITDAGSLAEGRLLSGGGVQLDRLLPLRDVAGHIYLEHAGDAEGLAIDTDGTVFVSFEQRHMVTRFAPDGTGGVDLKPHPAFARYADNGSLEALAIDLSGRLYTMSEYPDARPRSFRLFRFDDGAWRVVHRFPSRNRFRVVGADIGDDGRFYVLERRITLIGFQSRIRRWTIADGLWHSEETIWQSNAGEYQNLEGISISHPTPDILRVTMIGDDNFLALLSTEIVQIDIKN